MANVNLEFLIGFNNYFNRKIIKFSNLEDYESESRNFYNFSDISFNPNDGVTTEQIINWNMDNESSPDYLIIFTSQTLENEEVENTIVSRWFVTEWVRTRQNQYKATLRRDVIADHFDTVFNSPCFIEKGFCSADNKLIYNSEGSSFNQIKRDQIPLKDETEVAWIVGYLNKSYRNSAGTPEVITSIHTDETSSIPTLNSLGIILNDSSDPSQGGIIKYAEVLDNNSNNDLLSIGITWLGQQGYTQQKISILDITRINYPQHQVLSYYNISGFKGRFATIYNDYISESLKTEFVNILKNAYPNIHSIAQTELHTNIDSELTTLNNYNKVANSSDLIVSHNNKYYKVIIGNTVYATKNSLLELNGNTYLAVNPSLEQWELLNTSKISYDSRTQKRAVLLYYNEINTTLTLQEVGDEDLIKVTIPKTIRELNDAPYDMFCLQYNAQNLSLAQQIAAKFKYGSDGYLYDIQILPYCPARFALDDFLHWKDEAYIESLVEGVDFSYILDGNDDNVDKIYYCRKSSDTFGIIKTINIPERYEDPAINIKISNECDYYRLTSPNSSSSFEFSLAKNGGIDTLKVSYTYRPQSPYIKVTIGFTNMYGDEFKDARGLILSGDYSIDVISDAWVNYQIQNKNYENIFNTEIKSMDAIADIQERMRWINVATSGAKGAVKGMLFGKNPIAGAVGAAAGLTSGIANAISESEIYDIQRQEKIDLYNFNLGNIKALPNTLNKISAYNIDNNYFPVIEIYSASDEEIDSLYEKIRYNSFTLMITSTLQQMLSNKIFDYSFVKGQIIRLEDFADDEHMANEIYREIEKGVYI